MATASQDFNPLLSQVPDESHLLSSSVGANPGKDTKLHQGVRQRNTPPSTRFVLESTAGRGVAFKDPTPGGEPIPGIYEILESVKTLDSRIQSPSAPAAGALDEKSLEKTLIQMHQALGKGKPFRDWFEAFILIHPDLALAKKANQKFSEKEAVAFIKDVYVKIAPWKVGNWETWFSGILATGAAVCSAWPTFKFVDKVVEVQWVQDNFSETFRSSYHDVAATAAFAQTLFISFNSGFTRFNQLLRYIFIVTKDEFKQDLKNNTVPLTITVMSAVVSFLQSWTVFAEMDPPVRWALSLGRALSAINTNGIFMTNSWKKLGGHKKTAELETLFATKNKLVKLANGTQEEKTAFIKLLSDSNLLKILNDQKPSNDAKQAKQGLDNIFNAFFIILGERKPLLASSVAGDSKTGPAASADSKSSHKNDPSCCKCTSPETAEKGRSVTSIGLGLLTSLTYFATSLSIEQIISSPAEYGALVSVLAWTLGGSSVAVNTAIAAASLNKFMKELANAEIKGFGDILKLALEAICLLGKATADVGMSIFQPIIENGAAKIMIAGLTCISSLAIGHLSVDNFFSQMKNGYLSSVKKALEKAKNADNLSDYYRELADEADSVCGGMEQFCNRTDTKEDLIRLLVNYIEWGFDSLADNLNSLTPAIANELFSVDVKKQFHARRAKERHSENTLFAPLGDQKVHSAKVPPMVGIHVDGDSSLSPTGNASPSNSFEAIPPPNYGATPPVAFGTPHRH